MRATRRLNCVSRGPHGNVDIVQHFGGNRPQQQLPEGPVPMSWHHH